jgi:hypothetical protein
MLPATSAVSGRVRQTAKRWERNGRPSSQLLKNRHLSLRQVNECNGLIATISGEPFKMEFPFSGYFIERPRLHDSIQGVLTEAQRFSSNPLHPDNG